MALVQILIGALLFSMPLIAQHVASELSGQIALADESPAQAAFVQLTNDAIQLMRTSHTDVDGTYRFLALQPGTYTITVEKEGFATAIRSGIEIGVSQRAVLDFQLRVGDLRESIVVEGTLESIDTSSAQSSHFVPNVSLRDLPLNGRDLFQLVHVQPGVVPSTNAGTTPFTSAQRAKASVQGTRPTMNNTTLDGVDLNDPAYNTTVGGASGAHLGVEAVKEFRVVSIPLNAEFGRNGGANLQYVTKSGTNQIHGSLYVFERNSILDTRNFFDAGRVPTLIRHQFGASLGGPIQKSKTFYFLNYEGFQERRDLTSSTTVLDDNARRGLLPSASNPAARVNVEVDSEIAPFLEFMPKANGPALGGGLALLRTVQKQPTTENFATARLDHYLRENTSLWARYVLDYGGSTAPFLSTSIPGFPARRDSRNQYALIGWNEILSPNLFNNLLLHLNRTGYMSHAANNHPASISLTPGRPLGSLSIAGLPLLGNNYIYPFGGVSNTFELVDNVIFERGQHRIRFGTDLKRLQMNGPFDLFKDGAYLFNDLSAFGFPTVSANPALEAFLQAQPFVYLGVDPTLSNSHRGYRQTYAGLYLQDDWRLLPSLTVNLGLRWEYSSNPTETHGRISNIRDLARAATPTPGRVWESVPLDVWSPRVGLAWKPAPRTVIRAGVGILRDQLWMNTYSVTRVLEPDYRALLYVLPQFKTNPGVKDIIGLGGPPSTISLVTDYRPKFPYYVRFLVNVQRELAGNWLIQGSYVGSRGLHLARSGEVNLLSGGRALNPGLGSVTTLATDGTSDYHSMQLSAERRFTTGFQLQASYTWSKSLDDASGFLFSDWTSETGVAQDFYNRRAERGRSAFDRRHVFAMNGIYSLPVWSRWTKGWIISGIVSATSNAPFSPNLGSFSNAGTFTASPSERPDLKSGVSACDATTGNPDHWFDESIFRLPAPGRYGNAGRNILCGPGLVNVDVAVSKTFAITRDSSLTFRAEVFNAANHANFDTPINTPGVTGNGGNGQAIFVGRRPSCDPVQDASGCGISAPNVGRIFRTVTPPRQIQLAVRLVF